jgi:hypothetical protein
MMKAMEMIKVRELVPWKERATAECMYACPSAGRSKVASKAVDAAKTLHAAKAMDAAKALHAAEAVTSKTTHRVGGQRHRRGKHRHHGNTSDCYFATHDNPPDCQKSPHTP